MVAAHQLDDLDPFGADRVEPLVGGRGPAALLGAEVRVGGGGRQLAAFALVQRAQVRLVVAALFGDVETYDAQGEKLSEV